MVEIFKALSDDNRLRLINILANQALCVCELEVLLEMNQSNVSRHLAKLKSSRITTALKEGQWVHYKLGNAFVEENEQLANYLKLKFSENSIYKRDLDRYKIYHNSGYTCQNIRNDKDTVEKFINDMMPNQ